MILYSEVDQEYCFNRSGSVQTLQSLEKWAPRQTTRWKHLFVHDVLGCSIGSIGLVLEAAGSPDMGWDRWVVQDICKMGKDVYGRFDSKVLPALTGIEESFLTLAYRVPVEIQGNRGKSVSSSVVVWRSLLRVLQGVDAIRVIGIIFLIDSAIEHHRFTSPNTSKPQYSCISEISRCSNLPRNICFCPRLSQLTFQCVASIFSSHITKAP